MIARKILDGIYQLAGSYAKRSTKVSFNDIKPIEDRKKNKTSNICQCYRK